MITNKIIFYIKGVLSMILLPVVIVSTTILGFCVVLSFGFLLFPITFIWSFFHFPLLGLSFIWENYKLLRPIASIIGIPLAILAFIFIILLPSMGENDSKMTKWLSVSVFPFSYSYSLYTSNNSLKRGQLIQSRNIFYKNLLEIFYREKMKNPLMKSFIDKTLHKKTD
jgi:hypothetical protein